METTLNSEADMVNPIKSGTTSQILKAIKQLNPGATDAEAMRRVIIALVGDFEEQLSAMRHVFLGDSPSEDDIQRYENMIRRYILPLDAEGIKNLEQANIILAYPGADIDSARLSGSVYTYDLQNPEGMLKSIISAGAGNDYRLAIGARFPATRTEIARSILREISRENAVFAITTALGNVTPNILQPFLGVAEGVGDMVILTSNQVRMMFMLGAEYGSKIGFLPQWKEISSIVGAAFGWRALARELVSKIPFGGGLAPKGAIAYAGTTVIGEGLIFFYTTGRRMTRRETAQAFKKAYSDAAGVARSLVERFRPSTPAVGAGDDPGDKGALSG